MSTAKQDLYLRVKRLISRLIVACVAIYVATFLTLTFSQRSYMYFPDKGDERHYLSLAHQQHLTPWRSGAGKLIGWKRVGKSPAIHRMLVFHGAGGNALGYTSFLQGLASIEEGRGWDFFYMEFPGYGSLGGSPTEASIIEAANEAIYDLKKDKRPLFLTGVSLGSGIACLAAGENPDVVQGIFLVTPYTSAADIAAEQFPIFPVRLVMQDKYEAAAALEKYSGPVAFLLAGRDEIVPTRFGQALYDGYAGPKKLWIQESAGHNTLDFNPQAAWWREVSGFLLEKTRA